MGRRDVGDGGDGVDGGGINGNHYVMNQTTLLGENLVRSSLLSRKIEIRGLFPALLIPR